MTDDIDRSDEFAELIAEDQRREATAGNGWTDHIPPPDEPPDVDEHHPGEYTPNNDNAHEPADDEQVEDEATAWEKAVNNRAVQYKIERQARQRVDDEMRPPVNYPPVRPLTALLDEHFGPIQYRIEGVSPTNGRALLVAQYKAGKTTLVGNLIRALADDEPFLGHFDVTEPAKAIVLIDNEMSGRTVQRWMRDQRIRNTGAVADVITLRGNVGAFNLLDEQCRAAWVQRLAAVGCDYLIIDCLRPVLDALGMDENRDVGRFLVAWDALMKEAAIPDATLVQHMGHANERARGDSRLLDWPDVGWKLVRENDDPASPRYFSAYGRDVNVPEGRLSFDPNTRHLTYTVGSRHAVQVEEAVTAIIKLLAESARDGEDGMSVRAIQTALADDQPRDTVREALKKALDADDGTRLIGVKKGPRNAKLHHILHPCSGCGLPVLDGGPRHQSCPSEIDGLFDE